MIDMGFVCDNCGFVSRDRDVFAPHFEVCGVPCASCHKPMEVDRGNYLGYCGPCLDAAPTLEEFAEALIKK